LWESEEEKLKKFVNIVNNLIGIQLKLNSSIKASENNNTYKTVVVATEENIFQKVQHFYMFVPPDWLEVCNSNFNILNPVEIARRSLNSENLISFDRKLTEDELQQIRMTQEHYNSLVNKLFRDLKSLQNISPPTKLKYIGTNRLKERKVLEEEDDDDDDSL